MDIFSYTDLVGAQPIFLLEIQFASKTWRFASFPVQIYDAVEGRNLAFVGGLNEFDLSEQSDLLGVDLEANAIRAQVIFDADLLQLWRQGHVLEGAPATFSFVLQKDGAVQQNYADRAVLLTGIVQQPQFGDPLDPVGACSLSVEYRPFDTETGGLVLDPDFIIDDNNFPDHDTETATGKIPPLVISDIDTVVINNGGLKNASTFTTPAYCIQIHTVADHCLMLIAAHKVEANYIKISDPFGVTGNFLVLDGVTSTGFVYSYIDIDGSSLYQPGVTYLSGQTPSKKEWWVTWDHVPTLSQSRGGIKNPSGPGPLAGGGDICLWALQLSGIDYDVGAWGSLLPALNVYRFHGYINDPGAKAWDWLSSHILPYLPIEIRNGSKGIRPLLAQIYAARHVQAAISITMGPNFLLSGPITTQSDTSELINDVTVYFAKDGPRNDYTCFLRIGAGLEDTGFATENSAEAIISQSRYGQKSQIVELDYCIDRSTAAAVGQLVIQSQAFPSRTFPVQAAIPFGWLVVGDIVALTSSTLYLSDTKCSIVGKKWAGTHWEFELLLIESLQYTSRAL